jgi:hypothetical protein
VKPDSSLKYSINVEGMLAYWELDASNLSPWPVKDKPLKRVASNPLEE